MSNRLYLLNQAKYIQETYGEDTVACLFAKDVEDYLHSSQVINGTVVREHPSTPSQLKLEEEVKSFTWKAD